MGGHSWQEAAGVGWRNNVLIYAVGWERMLMRMLNGRDTCLPRDGRRPIRIAGLIKE